MYKDEKILPKEITDSMRRAYLMNDLPNVIKISPYVFDDILVTMKHALVFIATRQKMHEDGIKLYQKLLRNLESLKTDTQIASL